VLRRALCPCRLPTELSGRIKNNRPTAATSTAKAATTIKHEGGDDEHYEDETCPKTHSEIQNAVSDLGHLISQELLQGDLPGHATAPPQGAGEYIEKLGSKAGLCVSGKSRRDPRGDDL